MPLIFLGSASRGPRSAVGITSLALLILAASSELFAQSAPHPSQEIELNYAEAVLAYNRGQYPRALGFLDQLLGKQPDSIEALELQALTLKVAGKDREALTTYGKLMKLKPPPERGPYHFEGGVILYKNGAYEKARVQLARAESLGFNREAAQFFYGLSSVQLKDWSAAEAAFEKVAKGPKGDLEMAAHYYLALVRMQDGYTQGATFELLRARDRANESPDSDVSKQIGTAADKALEPYRKGQWFGNLSAMLGYDTNVSLINQSDVSADQVSGSRTPKLSLTAGIGRMTSPLSLYQFVGSYRSTYNQNTNSEADSFEFWTHTVSLYLTRKPLAQTNLGLKAEGSATLQNKPNASDPTKHSFRPYNYSLEAGPYVRSEILRRVQFNGEFDVRPTNFPGQESLGSSRQGGVAYVVKGGLRQDSRSPLYNPDATLSGEINQAKGDNFRARSLGLRVGNTFRFPGGHLLIAGAQATLTHYKDAFPKRLDKTWTFQGSWIKGIGPHWSLVGDLSHQINTSKNSNYAYDKTTVSFGVSYTF